LSSASDRIFRSAISAIAIPPCNSIFRKHSFSGYSPPKPLLRYRRHRNLPDQPEGCTAVEQVVAERRGFPVSASYSIRTTNTQRRIGPSRRRRFWGRRATRRMPSRVNSSPSSESVTIHPVATVNATPLIARNGEQASNSGCDQHQILVIC
jgi:hypothetical protein